MRLIRLAVLAAALVPMTALAGTMPTQQWVSMPTAPKKGTRTAHFSGKGQMGFVASQGNAQGKSANVALDLKYVSGLWKHTLTLAMLYGQSSGVVSAERWSALWQSERKFTAKAFAFGAVRYEHDMFDGFQYQRSAAVGIGYTVVHTKATTLRTQLGAGYTMTRPETLKSIPILNASRIFIERTPLAEDNYAIGTVGVDYEHKITDTTSVSDKLLVNAGSSNTLLTNHLALVLKVSTKLAMSLGYELQDNTHPPAGIKKLDSTETANLVYAF